MDDDEDELAVTELIAGVDVDEPNARILDAAVELVGKHGERATTMDHIAERSRVARATVFRRFPNKRILLDSAVTWELGKFARELNAATSNEHTAAAAVAAVVITAIDFVDRSPLLSRLAAEQPDQLVIYARAGGRLSMLTLGRVIIARGLRQKNISDPRIQDVADLACHLAIAYALIPNSSKALRDREVLRNTLRTMFGAVIG